MSPVYTRGEGEGEGELAGGGRVPPLYRGEGRSAGRILGYVKRAGRPLRHRRGGKSGLHRAGCWVTPRRSDATESATETIAPMASHAYACEGQARVKRCGKSAPGPGASRDAGKPHPEQGQIGGRLRWSEGRARLSSPGRPHDPFRQRRDQIDGRRPAFTCRWVQNPAYRPSWRLFALGWRDYVRKLIPTVVSMSASHEVLSRT